MGKQKKNVLNVRWFKEQIRATKTSQRQIAFKMGLDPTVISHVFNGRRKISFEEALKWAEILGQPVSAVASNAGIDIPESELFKKAESSVGALFDTVPVIGWIDPAFNVVLGLAKGPQTVPNPILSLPASKDLVALRCQTGGFMDGALFYYFQHSDPAAFYEALERSCVVKIGNGKRLVRLIKRGYEPGKFNLHGFNGELLEESVVVLEASPVVWMKL